MRDYIETATWYLKSMEVTNAYSKQNWYTCERSNNTTVANCSSGYQGTFSTKTSGKIGLMYVSDYLFASGNYTITDTTTADDEDYGIQNWLYKSEEWTMNPNATSNTYAMTVSNYSSISGRGSYAPVPVRPSFYLKSNIKIKSGEGTYSNPYILGY